MEKKQGVRVILAVSDVHVGLGGGWRRRCSRAMRRLLHARRRRVWGGKNSYRVEVKPREQCER